jgi:hypothetical protein
MKRLLALSGLWLLLMGAAICLQWLVLSLLG